MSEPVLPVPLRSGDEELRRSLDETLFYLPDALLETDLETRRLVYMNRMGLVVFGYAREDLGDGIPAGDLFQEGEFERAEALAREYAGRAFDEKRAYTRSGTQELHEFRMRRRDGTGFFAETQTSFVLDGDGVPRAMRTFVRDVTARKLAEQERERLVEELRAALDQVRKLRGLLPICASCTRVRDDRGYWNRLEAFFREHSDLEFSHGICPECMKEMYGDDLS